MTRRLRRLAAVLFVVTAGLFLTGVNAENDIHDETTETESNHNETTEEGDAGHDESEEAGSADEEFSAGAERDQDESVEDEKLFGVDVESPAAVALAVIVSVALAIGLWLRNLRWLALAAAAVGMVFAAFDVAEVIHQLDESRTGLAVLAAAIALGHAAAGGAAALAVRSRA